MLGSCPWFPWRATDESGKSESHSWPLLPRKTSSDRKRRRVGRGLSPKAGGLPGLVLRFLEPEFINKTGSSRFERPEKVRQLFSAVYFRGFPLLPKKRIGERSGTKLAGPSKRPRERIGPASFVEPAPGPHSTVFSFSDTQKVGSRNKGVAAGC